MANPSEDGLAWLTYSQIAKQPVLRLSAKGAERITEHVPAAQNRDDVKHLALTRGPLGVRYRNGLKASPLREISYGPRRVSRFAVQKPGTTTSP